MEKLFCKYRETGAIGDEKWTRLLQILVDRSIYFARPSTLNDPYDCRPATTAPPAQELRKVAARMRKSVKKRLRVKGKMPEGARSDTDVVLHLSNSSSRNEEVFTALNQSTSVFCTSLDGLSNQQWAYYGDSHKGVCLEFSFDGAESFYTVPVEYTDERPVIDVARFVTDDDYRRSALMKAVSTKSKDWQHEREVRWFQMDEGAVTYPVGMLTSVILGLAVEEAIANEIVNILSNLDPKPRLFRCQTQLDSYELTLDEIEI